MGAVYYAVEKALDRPVALKLLPAELSAQPGFADRFTREARAMAKLSHPNIVALYEFGRTSAGHLFFTMEFVEGTTLAAMIHGAGLASAQALSIASQICLGLAYAHEQAVVHRDVKPSNILIDPRGLAKIADFGLARLLDPSEVAVGHTVTGAVMGTPEYMAPEQKRGMAVDHRADIYSLGVMLYEMLCRQTPQGAFPPPSQLVGCDSGVDRIVARAMQPDRERRYQSTAEMRADIDAARSTFPPSKTTGRRTRVMSSVLLMVLALVMVAGAWRWLRPGAAPAPTADVVAQKGANQNQGRTATPSGSGWREGYQEFVEGRIRPEFLATNRHPGQLTATRDVYIHLDGAGGRAMRNQSLRMRVRGVIFNVNLRMENRTTQEARSYTFVYDRAHNVIELRKGTLKESVKLAEGERPRPHQWEKPHDLEFRVIGDLISVFLDGRQVIAKRDADLPLGHIRVFANSGSAFHRIAWIDLGDGETIPPLPGWEEPVVHPPQKVPEVASDQWRDGIALFEQGVLGSAPFVRQADGTLVAQVKNALLNLRAPRESLLEDQILRVRVRGDSFTLEARRTESDAGGKAFAFGFRYQSRSPLLALTNPWKGNPAEIQVSQTPPPDFDWAATHTLTLAAVGDRVTAWLDDDEILTMRRQGPLSGHMAIRADKGSTIERIQFADLGKSGPPLSGPVESLNGHRYQVVWAQGILWQDAKAQAEKLGGHLAVVTTDQEHELVCRMCAGGLDEMGGGGQFWLGGFRGDTAPREWRWVTGEPLTYSRWPSGKPSPRNSEAALALSSRNNVAGWNDFFGPNERGNSVGWWIQGYVMEWDD